MKQKLKEKILFILKKLLLFILSVFMVIFLIGFFSIDVFVRIYRDEGYRELKAYFHSIREFVEYHYFKFKAISFFSIPYIFCGLVGLLTNKVGLLVIHLTFNIGVVVLTVLLLSCCTLTLAWLVEGEDGKDDITIEDQDLVLLIIILCLVLVTYMTLQIILELDIIKTIDQKKSDYDSESASLAESEDDNSNYEREHKSNEAYV